MTIYLHNGSSRIGNMQALLADLFPKSSLTGKSIILKPNFTSCDHQLANTHPDSLGAVLDALFLQNPSKVTVAEGSGESWQQAKTTKSTLEKFGAWEHIERTGANFVDLNTPGDYMPFTVSTIYGSDTIKVNTIFKKYDVCISMSVPKSHDYAIMTSSTKNFAMPMVNPSDRVKMHGLMEHTQEGENYINSVKLIHKNLANLIKLVKPTHSIVDGFVGMEQDGPLFGTSVACGWALGSNEPVVCDCILAQLMGLDPMEVGYLNYLCAGKMPKVTIEDKISNLKKTFALHRNIATQSKWK